MSEHHDRSGSPSSRQHWDNHRYVFVAVILVLLFEVIALYLYLYFIFLLVYIRYLLMWLTSLMWSLFDYNGALVHRI